MWSWRTSTLMLLSALLAVAGAYVFSTELRELTRPVFSQVGSLFTFDAPTGRRVYASKDNIGRSEESQITGMMDSAVALATGASTSNFQEVRALAPTMSLSRLSRSVGMLIFTERLAGGGTQSYSCTGFMISPRYLLTAAHCFFADPDSRTWSKPAKLTDLDFVPNFVEPGSLSSIPYLKLKTQTIGKETVFWRELACPGNACSLKGDEKDGHDFAVLELTEDSVTKARTMGVSEAILGDVALGPQQQLVIFQHPGGGQMMFVERHCLTVGNIDAAKPTREFFKHFCDTLDGSSGAPVFSRDHEVVVGLHVQGSRPFTAAERTSQSRANGAIHVGQIAAISKVIGDVVSVQSDPPTAEQSVIVRSSDEAGEQALGLLTKGRTTLASFLALDGLEKLIDRSDSDFLFSRASKAENALTTALATRTELAAIHPRQGGIKTVAFSRDGSRVVVAAGKVPQIYDAHTWRTLRTLIGHGSFVNDATFSPDGSHVATASYDHTVRIWNARNGAEVKAIYHPADVFSVAYSHDGSLLASTSYDGYVWLWNGVTGEPVRRFPLLRGPFGNKQTLLYKVAFSPDGTRIAVATPDGAQIVDPRNGTVLSVVAQDDQLHDVAFSPDGKRVVTAGWNEVARVWTLGDRAPPLPLRGHRKPLQSAKFSHDGKQIVTASKDGTARIWDSVTGETQLTLTAGDGTVEAATFSADDTQIVTGGGDSNTVRVWDVAGRIGPLRIHVESLSGGITNSIVSPDGKVLFGLVPQILQPEVYAWNSKDGRVLWRVTVGNGPERGQGFALSPDSSQVAVGFGNSVKLLGSRNGRELRTLRLSRQVSSVAYSSAEVGLLAAGDDETITVWDARTGRFLLNLESPERFRQSLAFSPDGKFIVTDSDKAAVVWSLASRRKTLSLIGHESHVTSAVFSPDGKHVLTGAFDNTARLWEADTGRLLRTLKGHDDAVRSVAFSSNGALVATASEDETARIWDASTGRAISILVGHTDFVLGVGFSRANDLALTASQDGSVRLWRVWPRGKDLIKEAYCRLRLVRPSKDECLNYSLNCSLDRSEAADCDPGAVWNR